MSRMTRVKLWDVLSETNPGLTDTELGELVEALVEYIPSDPNYIGVPKRLVESSLEAVDKLKSTIESITPQDVNDVILINELGTLRYHLSEILQKY